jgi:hypothetical protein
MRRVVVVALFLFVGIFMASPAQADLMFISPLGEEPGLCVDEGGTSPCSPSLIGSDGFRLTYHGNGAQQTVEDPVLLILGIPTGTVVPVLTIDDVEGSATGVLLQAGVPTELGGNWDASGYAGTFTQAGNLRSGAPNPEVYEFIGLTPGTNSTGATNSNNWVNWSGATGLSSWDLYVWTITFTPDFNAKNPDWIDIAGQFADGTYAIAYSCETINNDGTCSQNNVQSTPFTRAGLVQTPEPASVLLLLPGLALLFRRRLAA